MSLIDSLSFFLIMVVLAAIPSTSVALVVIRSTTLGISNGIAAALGIVLGDLVFIALAILGLSVIAETMGSLFLIIKYIGGAYLMWLGYSLLSSRNKTVIAIKDAHSKGSLVTGFLAGFFLTLGDIKAIFFYASLFPTFVDPGSLTILDIISIIGITIITVGGIKMAYAFSAITISERPFNSSVENITTKTAGSLMIGAGSYLIIKA